MVVRVRLTTVSRIVAVAPTLADAVQSAGRTLAVHAANGHEVIVVAVFEGPADGAADAIEALGIAGAASLGIPAGGDDLEPRLAVVLVEAQPDLLLAPIGLTGDDEARVIDDALHDL